MQKTTSALLGAFVVIATVIVIWRAGPRRDGAVVVPPVSSVVALPDDPPASSALEAPLRALEEQALRPVPGGRPGTVLLDGTVPGALPAESPREVRFGVVLITYRGAERAPSNARSKEDALKLAGALAAIGKSDFKAAVEKGDDGSAESLGWMQRGVLEPAPNYVLFMLPPGEVSEPVDTPTGFWVMKNLSK